MLRKLPNTNLRKTQETDKVNHGKRVKFEPTFATGASVLTKRLTLTASPAEPLALERHLKLLPH